MWIILFFIGILSWTFTEYVLHRFLGHVYKGKNFFKDEHSVHHSKANYFAPFYKKIIAAFVISLLLLLILILFISLLNAILFIVGYIGMYCIYEITHYRYHNNEPLVKPFIILRKHHFYHHFHNPNMNHGVTTRFWDRVFGTFQLVEKVKIPKSMTMNWLVADSKIKPIYSKYFQLNSR